MSVKIVDERRDKTVCIPERKFSALKLNEYFLFGDSSDLFVKKNYSYYNANAACHSESATYNVTFERDEIVTPVNVVIQIKD
jgi:hypothetical protein